MLWRFAYALLDAKYSMHQSHHCYVHFAGVTNLSQNQGGGGNSFLSFGQFSVPCGMLIHFGSRAFPVDQHGALLILVELSNDSQNRFETCLFVVVVGKEGRIFSFLLV